VSALSERGDEEERVEERESARVCACVCLCLNEYATISKQMLRDRHSPGCNVHSELRKG
jgi:hypothetical protein